MGGVQRTRRNGARKWPDLSHEARHRGLVAGIDEAGRGPWAGPVVAAAVILIGPAPEGVDDSKRLSRQRRQALYETLREAEARGRALTGLGIATVTEIDRLNIARATLLAMRRAFDALGVRPAVALVDGLHAPALPCAVETLVRGDEQSLSIAAASIIAKVTRDRIMMERAAVHPGYGWERNAGYGTPEHARALDRLGISPDHRRSFAPVRKLLR